MALKSAQVLLLAILSVVAVAVAVPIWDDDSESLVLGNWKPIENLNDPEIVSIARFAVAEHNREKKETPLFLRKVVKGEMQVVAGINYKLQISAGALGDLHPKIYTAVVFKGLKLQSMKLISFA